MLNQQRSEERNFTNWKLVALMACLILAVVLRIWAALDDFWLDEIWSLRFIPMMNAWWDVITKIHHDNNHILHTLYLYLIGDHHNWVWYRLLSIVTGTALVALLGYATLQRSFLVAITTVLLAGLSFPLILYSSEARGYAPATFFAFLSFFLIQEYWRCRSLWRLILFWASVALGFLSHLSFICVYLSIMFWSSIYETQIAEKKRVACVELIKVHAIPILFIAMLYLIFIRHLVYGGAPVYKYWDVIRRTLLLAVGAPDKGAFGILGIVGVGMTFFYGIFSLKKEKSGLWCFFLSVLFLAPAFILIVKRPEILLWRYFLVCFPFFYLLLGHILASCYRHSNRGKLLYVIVLLLVIAGNIHRTSQLLTTGRGSYREAVLYMAENTTGADIIVGSDHDFRNRIILDFYARYLPPGKRIVYLNGKSWPANGPDWFITHSLDINYKPSHRLIYARRVPYTLERSFRYSGFSGWHWFIYRNAWSMSEHRLKQ